jgi:branched-chain amino acid transport system permease protein
MVSIWVSQPSFPVLGGFRHHPGAMFGGFVIGLVESFTTSYVSSSMADAFVFLILIIVLIIKPAGILGKNMGEKV